MKLANLTAMGLSPHLAAVIGGTLDAAVTAAGTTTSDATVLTNDINIVTTAAADSGVRLKPSEKSSTSYIRNDGAGRLKVYPPSGGTFNAGAADIPMILAMGDSAFITYSTAIAVSATGFRKRPELKRVAITTNTGTLSAGDMEGADYCILHTSGQATPTHTTRTGTELAANIANLTIGDKYLLKVMNANSGTCTMSGGSGVTISGTATIATGVCREFLMEYTAANTWTMTSVGLSTTS